MTFWGILIRLMARKPRPGANGDLTRIAAALSREIRALVTRHQRNPALPLDVSKLNALTQEVQTIAGQFQADVAAAAQVQVTAAVAKETSTNQATLDAAVAPLAAAVDQLKTAAAPPAAGLTVTPTAETVAGGAAATLNLTISGGTPPYSFSGLPAGVTIAPTPGGSASDFTLTADGTQVAGTTDATVTDSSTPPLTGALQVVVS